MRGRLEVSESVGSTQDIAREMPHGSVVTALRQTAGRGRLGRSWADTGDDGVALSMVLEDGGGPAFSCAVALAAAEAIEEIAPSLSVQVKWPNDLMLNSRKCGGILIERVNQPGGAAVLVVGIGINVSHTEFPPELEGRATSLRLCGAMVDRLGLLGHLLPSLWQLNRWNGPFPSAQFVRRDWLRGRTCRMATASGEVRGRVCSVDPLRGLEVESDSGSCWLPAATTSVLASD